MAWLNFNLPLHEELEVEKHARMIRDCEDLAKLREIAEQAFRAWCTQADITNQLLGQIADCEVTLANLGVIEEPDPEYLQWARELYPQNDGEDPR